ncbi:MAG TPA: hypothetical protein VH643_31575 [Gemmataceae bacterium]|jgi:hypothetical protein
MNPSAQVHQEALDKTLSTPWAVCGVVCAWIIGATDDSVATALLWSMGSIVFGDRILPALMSRAHRVSEHSHWDLRDVVFGWGLVPGPLVGSCFGVVAPLLWELPITSFQGGLIGLILGPIFSAVEGLVIFSMVLVIWRVVSGRMMPGTHLWPSDRVPLSDMDYGPKGS